MALLPSLLYRFACWKGLTTKYHIEASTLTSLFAFTFFATLVLPTLVIGSVSALSDLLEDLAREPFPQLMGLLTRLTSPSTGLFIALLIQSALPGTALALLRVGPFLLRRLKLQFATTEDQIADANEIEPFLYYVKYPELLLALTITLFFSLTMPVTCPFGMLFFLCRYCGDRYLLAYVHPKPVDTGGRLFARAVKLILLLHLTFIIATCGMFAGKRVPVQFSLSVLVLAWFAWTYRERTRRLKAIFLADECIPDRSRRLQQGEHQHDEVPSPNLQLQPASAAEEEKDERQARALDRLLYKHPALKADMPAELRFGSIAAPSPAEADYKARYRLTSKEHSAHPNQPDPEQP